MTFHSSILNYSKLILTGLLTVLLMFSACKKDEEALPPPPPVILEIDTLIDSIRVTPNPFGNVPLAAHIKVNISEPCQLEYTIQGAFPIFKNYTLFAEEFELDIVGLYGGRENEIIIKVETEAGFFQLDTLKIETPAHPAILPTIEIEDLDSGKKEPGFTFAMYEVSTSGFYTFPIIFDDAGEIRWYMSFEELGNYVSPGEFLANGHLSIGLGANIYEYSLMGEEVNRITISGYHQHHDIFEKEDGNFIVAVTKNGETTFNDFIIEVDGQTNDIIREIDLRESMDQTRDAITPSSTDWAHVNSVFHDPVTDHIIVSARTQAIFAISMDNELQWILGGHKEWGTAGNGADLNDFLLTAIDENGIPFDSEIQIGNENHPNFGWSFGQHSAEVLPNGNIIAFDNGSKRNYSSDLKYSRGVEYQIDPINKTVQQVWEYGKERELAFYSQYEGDMDVLPITENRLLCSAKAGLAGQKFARIIELTKEGAAVVFQAKIPFPTISNGVGTGVYRAERISL